MWTMRADEITKSGEIAPFPIALYRPELIPGQFQAARQAFTSATPRNAGLAALAQTASVVAESFARGRAASFTLPGTTKSFVAQPGMTAAAIGGGLAGVVVDAANLAARGQPVVIRSEGAAAVVLAARGTNRVAYGARF